jgi:hypothetical protein
MLYFTSHEYFLHFLLLLGETSQCMNLQRTCYRFIFCSIMCTLAVWLCTLKSSACLYMLLFKFEERQTHSVARYYTYEFYHLRGCCVVYASDIGVIAKIESIDALKNLEEIIRASDGIMVARGDLGAQIPLEQVPSIQQTIVKMCRQLNKPVIIASQLLESMIEYPTPTRAEVADVSEAVRQRADALMLSGESAMGRYPEKALSALRGVSLRIERWWREEKRHEALELPAVSSSFSDKISEEICNSAAKMGMSHNCVYQ